MSDSEQSSGTQSTGDSADDGTNDQNTGPELAPIPSEGTSAPADTDRVFGRPVDQPDTGQPVAGSPTAQGTQPGQPSPDPSFPQAWQAPPIAGPQVSDEERKKLRTRGRLALVFGIVAVPTAILFFPLGLAMGLTGVVLGTLAYRGAKRVGLVAAGAVPGIVLGIVATVLASVAAAVTVTFWTEVTEFATCQDSSITLSAQAECQQNFEKSIEERLLGPSGLPR